MQLEAAQAALAQAVPVLAVSDAPVRCHPQCQAPVCYGSCSCDWVVVASNRLGHLQADRQGRPCDKYSKSCWWVFVGAFATPWYNHPCRVVSSTRAPLHEDCNITGVAERYFEPCTCSIYRALPASGSLAVCLCTRTVARWQTWVAQGTCDLCSPVTPSPTVDQQVHMGCENGIPQPLTAVAVVLVL